MRGRLRQLLPAVLLAGSGCSGAGPAFETGFAAGVERVWVGPDFYGNRLQDWRLTGGRVEATEGRDEKPMRTLQLLTVALRERAGAATLTVRTGPIAAGPARGDTWTGFLLGAGGPDVDYRVTALVHHWPSTDGGLIAAIDGRGQVVLRDNSVHQGFRGPVPDIATEAWPRIEPVAGAFEGVAAASYLLRVDLEPGPTGYGLILEARSGETGELVSWAAYEGLPEHQLDGGIALASHRSPSGDGPGYWFDDLSVRGSKVSLHPERAFGPIMGAFHTLSGRTLKLMAQFGPLGEGDQRAARLEVFRDDSWAVADQAPIEDGSHTATFRVDGWDPAVETPYRVVYELATGEGAFTSHEYAGTVRAEPGPEREFVLAAFTGHNISGGDGQWNHEHFWYPHEELVEAVRFHEPDLLFFSGDQIYEAGLAGVVRAPLEEATLDYLYHWYRFVWAFRDLARDLPTVMTPDDHDVYHGNIWGNGGESLAGDFTVQDRGGYRMPPEWVNVVHRTQVSNLPDPLDPAPLDNGISVYHTRLEYGGISFAVVADRMFKSPPSPLIPAGEVRNGWFLNPDFDPALGSDVPGSQLLGERQERFLDGWVDDWSGGGWMKVLLSQSPFANVATIPDSAANGSVLPSLPLPDTGQYVSGDKKAADADSNGWPPSARDRALRTLRRGLAFHVSGDQHLGSFLHYGIEDFDDASYGFVVPSIANFWPRRWFPPEPGEERADGSPLYTGRHLDGFGNRMTVLAAANPVHSGVEPAALYDRTPGYGIVRFDRATRQITTEVWPRWVDPSTEDARQYRDWPVTVSQQDNDGRPAVAWLPTLVSEDMDEPVVQVVDEATGEVLYTRRIQGSEFRPHLFRRSGTYTVRIGEPGTPRMRELTGLGATDDPEARLEVRVAGISR